MSKRWTYQVLEFKPKTFGGLDHRALQDELNRQGAQGWEVVNVIVPAPMTPVQILFKKEV